MQYEAKLLLQMKEGDIRACVIDPLINRLGYDFGAENYVERERTLKYPYNQIGHPGPKDVPIGASDYICGVDGRRGSFVIEAKRGDAQLTIQDRAQAHSYAAHGEVGATFYCLCNGRSFQVFQTLGGIDQDPLLDLANHEFEQRFHEIAALLSPDKLADHSSVNYDLGLPLAVGYGSRTRVRNGQIEFLGYDLSFEAEPNDPIATLVASDPGFATLVTDLDEMLNTRQPVLDGIIERREQGRIIASLEFGSSRPELEHNMMALGIQSLMFVTDAEQISTDEEFPTVFETRTTKHVAEGTELFGGLQRRIEALQIPSRLELLIRGYGSLSDNRFIGSYESLSRIQILIPNVSFPAIRLYNEGAFSISVD